MSSNQLLKVDALFHAVDFKENTFAVVFRCIAKIDEYNGATIRSNLRSKNVPARSSCPVGHTTQFKVACRGIGGERISGS